MSETASRAGQGWPSPGSSSGIIEIGVAVLVVILIAIAVHSANLSYNVGYTYGTAGAGQAASSGGGALDESDYCSQGASNDPHPLSFYAGCMYGWNAAAGT